MVHIKNKHFRFILSRERDSFHKTLDLESINEIIMKGKPNRRLRISRLNEIIRQMQINCLTSKGLSSNRCHFDVIDMTAVLINFWLCGNTEELISNSNPYSFGLDFDWFYLNIWMIFWVSIHHTFVECNAKIYSFWFTRSFKSLFDFNLKHQWNSSKRSNGNAWHCIGFGDHNIRNVFCGSGKAIIDSMPNQWCS